MTEIQVRNAKRVTRSLQILLLAVLTVTIYLAADADSGELDKRKIQQYRRAIVANSAKGTDAIALLESSIPGLADWRRGVLLEELGSTGDPQLVDFLLDTAVRHRSGVIAARSGGALRHYESLEQTRRKAICRRLIKRLAALHDASAIRDPRHQRAATWASAHLQAISEPWIRTLRALTGRALQHPHDWVAFWNRNHQRDWDTRER